MNWALKIIVENKKSIGITLKTKKKYIYIKYNNFFKKFFKL